MKIRLICITAVLVIAFIVPAAAQTSVVVESFSGKVEYQSGGAWTAVSIGLSIPEGATISTGFRSEAVLRIGDSTLEVQPLTRMRIDELAEREGTVKTDLYLRVGRVKAEVRRTGGLQQEFRLRSPVSTAAVRGTSFSYDGYNLQVVEGLVALINAYGQSAGIPAGVSITSDGIEIPPGTLQALEQQFGVNISAAQIEELASVSDVADILGIETGSVTINWELPN
ncbi:FecR domain-containing protein [Marispirochaeta aestuarii]|uniref:FecR family protein n=1 Tax=Marispirochaeta aestuarii TaxID=1963862 RepID=UPI002ABD83E2|nr:FecR domain-containing protein [Marispirochaeta aestuarii]